MAREQCEIDITNEHGLHARPAARFVQTAARFQSSVTLRNLSKGGTRTVNAKSIMEVLTAGVDKGSRVEVAAEGEDAREAVEALRTLVEQGLNTSQ
jgi:phosphotransferase system HPr (HPr) family protein